MANYTLSAKITADASDFVKGVQSAKSEMGGLERFAKNAGKGISDFGGKVSKIGDGLTNKITKPAIFATTAITGMVGALGFKRLVGMDNAQAKLKGLGVEGEQLEKVMKDVNAAVTGTTHTMADGADVAAGALAAGVKEGKDLERYISLVGDAATGANRPMADMAQIFNRVQGSGKMMTMELNQIEHGMPGFSQAMAKHLDVAPEKMREMVTDGKVSASDFLDVMEDFAGGMSDAYAETWEGMAKNVISNIGIIGEALIGGLFEDGKKGMAEFLDVLRSDGLKEWAAETGESIRETASKFIEKLKEIKQWWDNLSEPIQNVIKKIALFGSLGAVALGPILKVLGPIISVVGTLVTKFGAVVGAVKAAGGAMAVLTGPVGIAIGVIAGLIGIGISLYKNWDTVKAKAKSVFGNFTPLIDRIKQSFETLKASSTPIMESLLNLWESLKPLLQTVGNIVAAVVVPAFGLLVGVFNGVVNAIGPIVNAVINLLDIIVNMVNMTVALLTGDFAGAWEYLGDIASSTIDFFVNMVNGVLDLLVGFVDGVIDFFYGLYMTLVGNSIVPDMVRAIVEWFKNMFSWVIDTVKALVDGTIKIFTKLYDRISTIFKAIWQMIKDVWSYIENTFKNALDFITALVTGDFKGMKKAMYNQMDNAKTLLSNIWSGIKKIIGERATQILTNVVSKFIEIKNNMQNKINEAKANVSNKFQEMKNAIQSKVSSIVSTIRTKFQEAKDKIIRPIEQARDKVKAIVDKIKSFFSNMKLSLPKISIPKLPKLPKPSISGKFSLLPPSVPKINWNAQGGVFSRPTIFNTANAGMQGVGEAGPEAILPLNNNVLGSIGRGIASTMSSGNGNTQIHNENTINVNATIRNEQDIDKLTKRLDETLSDLGNRRRAAFGG